MDIAQQLNSYLTLIDALSAAPREKEFVTLWDPKREPAAQTLTFGAFLDLAARYAALYRAYSVRERDTIILVLPQSIGLIAAFAGALMIGAVPTILAYPTFKVDPEKYRTGLQGVVRNLKARIVIADEGFPDHLAACVENVEMLRQNPFDLPAGGPTADSLADVSPADIAFIQHSAGTTGLQKGVALSHVSVLNQLRALSEVLVLTDCDRIASWLPLYHDMGLIACFILPLVAHIPLVMQSPTDWVLAPGSFLRLTSDYRCTLCWLPNFAFQFLARRVAPEDRENGLDLSYLRAVINCSEPVRAQSMDEFCRAYRSAGLSRGALQSCYAMAENTFAVTQSAVGAGTTPETIYVKRDEASQNGNIVLASAGDASAYPIVSSGRLLPDNEVRIVSEQGADVPEGCIGEILIRSNSLFQGYYNRPDLTERAFRDQWYSTRDTGFRLGDELFVLGRKDDLIIIGGKNLYPQDIEEIAAANIDIHDGRVVAFGLYNADLGTDDLVIVGEVNSEDRLPFSKEIEADIRTRVFAELSVSPRLVHIVGPKWIVKSTAGKPARSTTKRKLLRELPQLNRESGTGKTIGD